jgi:hypothetical protein
VSDSTPTPGSPAAVALGCLCPVIDNRRGAGYGLSQNGPLYVTREDCELHGSDVQHPVSSDEGRE